MRRPSIEQRITAAREAYLRALDAGHIGEAEWHETVVDRLLDQLAHRQRQQQSEREPA